MFDRKKFEETIETLAERFEKSAPTVADWLNNLYQSKDENITLHHICTLQTLNTIYGGNDAANYLYHRMSYLNEKTIGHIGF